MKKEIVDIIREASKMGAAEMLKALKPEEDRISQREAWRLFGMAFVKANEPRLSVVQGSGKNSTKWYSRAELVQLQSARDVSRIAMQLEQTL
jgi:hypothetical protein